MYYKTIKTNFHTHTPYCGHATGMPLDYLDKIEKYHIKTLGFSEHAYIDIPSFKHTIKSPEHMNMYYNDVLLLREKTDCEILVGLEVDYIPSFKDYYKELHEKFDYLSLSIHFVQFCDSYSYGTRFTYLDEMKLYCEYMESGMKSGLFAFVNHPDLFLNAHMNDYRLTDEIIACEEQIIDYAIKYDMPLELNIAQFRRYFELYQTGFIRDDFWTLVGKKKAKVIINFDAHKVEEINLIDYNNVIEYARCHNLFVISDFRKCDNDECN